MVNIEQESYSPDNQPATPELYPSHDQSPFDFITRHRDGSVSFGLKTGNHLLYTDVRTLHSSEAPEDGYLVQAEMALSDVQSRTIVAQTMLHLIPFGEETGVIIHKRQQSAEIDYTPIIDQTRAALQIIEEGCNIPPENRNINRLRIEDLDQIPDGTVVSERTKSSTDKMPIVKATAPSEYSRIGDYVNRKFTIINTEEHKPDSK